jgi:UrcA family protein
MRLFACLCIAAATLSAPALAQSTDTMVTAPHGRSIVVSIADLDLSSVQDQRRLDDRLWRAARDICTMTRLRDLNEHRLEGRCRETALNRARSQRAALIAD